MPSPKSNPFEVRGRKAAAGEQTKEAVHAKIALVLTTFLQFCTSQHINE
eukprot:SAG31_NODE_46793_length_253_cov_0.597403_1_plen_48_part_10